MIVIPDNIVDAVKSMQKPLIIGVSGFGGAGKSSFARALGEAVSSPIIGVDSFQKNRTDNNYSLWDIMDYNRLENEVIKPFMTGDNLIHYGYFDWATNGIKYENEVKQNGIIIIEGVGLFRPEINQYFGYKIWIDCPTEEATARGKKRDREEYQNPQDEKWDGVWKRNDEEYFNTFKPKEAADLVFNNCQGRE